MLEWKSEFKTGSDDHGYGIDSIYEHGEMTGGWGKRYILLPWTDEMICHTMRLRWKSACYSPGHTQVRVDWQLSSKQRIWLRSTKSDESWGLSRSFVAIARAGNGMRCIMITCKADKLMDSTSRHQNQKSIANFCPAKIFLHKSKYLRLHPHIDLSLSTISRCQSFARNHGAHFTLRYHYCATIRGLMGATNHIGNHIKWRPLRPIFQRW